MPDDKQTSYAYCHKQKSQIAVSLDTGHGNQRAITKLIDMAPPDFRTSISFR